MRDETSRTEVVEQAVRTAHRRLEELFTYAVQAFEESEDIEAVRDAFAALREELDVHFDQEDRLYYSTIGSLRPSLKPRLRAFAEGHLRFRLDLATIAEHLERADLEAAGRAFQDLTSQFTQHERSEERLLKSLDRDVAGAA
ncbi:MAG: hemerythrin domain-containing protein [Deltaproteobacteria bacterium]|nr:hemerythrin domain-containing protein [Deltaproteobacteria bacterium]MBW2446746.1 hemerythrin domain-containing protein [Deltaproteobacteria bacterium]